MPRAGGSGTREPVHASRGEFGGLLISVIIVTWNCHEYLRGCLEAVADTDEVIIVDNDSHDGTADVVARDYPWVRLLRQGSNRGFAAANNLGLTEARGEFILLLNPDTVCTGETVRALVDFLQQHPQVGIVGPTVINPDGSLQLACRRRIPTVMDAFWTFTGVARWRRLQGTRFARYNAGDLPVSTAAPVDAVSGACLMVRREVIEAIGGLDEAFFLFGEELDWCLRAKRAGWQVWYAPVGRVVHFKGGSTRKGGLRAQREFARAMWLFYRKHLARRYGPVSTAVVWLGIALYGVMTVVRTVLRPGRPAGRRG